MKLHAYRGNLSKSVMIQLVFAALISSALLTGSWDSIQHIFFANQQTSAGLILNGLILSLFLLGMIQIIILLFHYRSEEQQLATFLHNLDMMPNQLLDHVSPTSLIGSRYETLEGLRALKAEIDHQALASTLVASESTRTGMARFIHNILILCGVLGTIVSLSIALFGASSLLETAVSSSGMGMVIHGMSTALSTTMTAILCYIPFAYFHGAVQNIQTNILSAVEHVTTTRLLHMFRSSPETINQELVELLKQANHLVHSTGKQLEHMDMQQLVEAINQTAQQSQQQQQQMIERMAEIESTLQQGFRLPKS